MNACVHSNVEYNAKEIVFVSHDYNTIDVNHKHIYTHRISSNQVLYSQLHESDIHVSSAMRSIPRKTFIIAINNRMVKR